jgi:molybdopterin-containing oxidoreductase family iron-sulfur binding subunit
LEIIQQTHQLDAKSWAQAVHDGFVRDSQARFEAVSAGEVTLPAASDSWKKGWDESTYEIVFSPSSSVYDGRFANNAWLQELPDLLTKLTWGNAASISPRTAAKLGVRTGQTINVGNIGLPIVIQPGQADGTIGLTLGYGRTQSGMVGGNIAAGEQVGVDIRPLRTIDRWNFGPIKNVNPTMDWTRLAIVQEPWDIDQTGRNEIQARMFRDKSKSESERSWLIREGSFASYQEFLAKLGDGHGPGHAAVEEKGNGPSVRVNEQDKSASLQRDRKSLPAPLPVLNSGHYTSASAPAATGGDQDPHPAQHHWPEAFHLHQELFDITPGSRMEYTAQNPENKNMWGMAIDLNKCTGCNACVVACQSENNIPIVGREQVARGREMHWLRIDRYYGKNLYNEEAAESDDLQMVHQPVTCQHCENAPCETVCPVAATVHSSEGLNDMVYNRCIGTRYCGNNCPYKVRRFNYLNYSDAVTFLKYPGADKLSAADRSIQNLLMNPEVTIRSRGVMEKCTYCVQRISAGRINAKTDGNRPLGPNEITTACQDACPAKAITFGDINHLQSDVRKAHDNPRSYVMLEELNNHPRTRFLARVRNPHPALVDFDDRNSVRGYNKKMAAGKPPVADHKAEVERPQLEH